jgi:Tol biopolymer transport system component
MSTIDPLDALRDEFSAPVAPRPEFADALLERLLAELPAPAVPRAPVGRRLLERLFPGMPFRLRLALVVLAMLLLLAAVSTATYLVLRGTDVRNGPLTVVDETGITVIRSDGSAHTLVECPPTYECGVLTSVAWSSDGRRLAYATTSYTGASSDNTGIHIVELDGGAEPRHLRRIADGSLGCFGAFDVAWSPDDSRLAYACPAQRSGRSAIFVIRVDGSNRQRVATAGLAGRHASPSWSRDGTRLAFSVTRRGGSAIYVADVDGSERRRIATDGRAPAWSPDGTAIAYSADCGGIKLVTPRGRDLTPAGPFVCRSIGVVGRMALPTWSPDGTRIAVKARNALYVMRADGSRLRLVADALPSGVAGPIRAGWRPLPEKDRQGRRDRT